HSPAQTTKSLRRSGSIWSQLGLRRVRMRPAVEYVVPDLGCLVHRVGPVRCNRHRMVVQRTAGGIAQRNLAGEDLGSQSLGLTPRDHLLGPVDLAVAGEGKLAARTALALIDHGAN